jgi:hypothetical protein
MTDIAREDRELIDRYLADRLTGTEAHVVETRIVEDPVFRNEVELAAAFRDGLRELQDRGELTPLLSPRQPAWRQPRFGLAASAAAVALGLTSFLLYQRLATQPAAAASESLVFEQRRSAAGGADATWERSGTGTLELRFDVGPEPAPAYEVAIRRGPDAALWLRATAVTAADGEAVLRVDGRRFTPGDYTIRLAASGSSESPEFTLRVVERR